MKQPHFPGARPVFYCFLALNCQSDVVVMLTINELLTQKRPCRCVHEITLWDNRVILHCGKTASLFAVELP